MPDPTATTGPAPASPTSSIRFDADGAATASSPNRRMLLIHAHPDDETIGTGGVMAKYAAAGAQVSLVTCTLGEEGEILVPDLEHLHSTQLDELGTHRQSELATAMSALGIEDWRLLGRPGKYRDSGMAGEPTNQAENCFWRADLLAAATDLVPVIRQLRPQTLVTYDDFGGYGHPDHIQAHRVAMYGAILAAATTFRRDLGHPWDISKIYWTAFPKSRLRQGIRALRDSGDTSPITQLDPDDLPFGVDDELVTTRIDTCDFLAPKIAAMHAYPTQIDMESGFFALALIDRTALGHEYFRLIRGPLGTTDEEGFETDLFAGLAESNQPSGEALAQLPGRTLAELNFDD